eukprot:7562303-Pyramimonas_sp.AAC.1
MAGEAPRAGGGRHLPYLHGRFVPRGSGSSPGRDLPAQRGAADHALQAELREVMSHQVHDHVRGARAFRRAQGQGASGNTPPTACGYSVRMVGRSVNTHAASILVSAPPPSAPITAIDVIPIHKTKVYCG